MWPFFHKPDPSFLKASRSEQHEAIAKLISQGTFRSGYYALLLLSVLIITPGLLIDNVSIIIGGMILAPLLIPILSLSLSVVSGSVTGCLRALKILVISIILTIATSAVMTYLLAETYHVVTWIPETISPGIYIFIAFCSGTAAAFAWVKENLESAIAGIAIAVSLIPPLCAVGIGLALMQMDLMRNSLVIFIANLIGIALAAFIVFWVMGFLTSGSVEESAIEKSQ